MITTNRSRVPPPSLACPRSGSVRAAAQHHQNRGTPKTEDQPSSDPAVDELNEEASGVHEHLALTQVEATLLSLSTLSPFSSPATCVVRRVITARIADGQGAMYFNIY